MIDDRELFWQELIDLVVERLVVPIVGQDVLAVRTGQGAIVPFHHYLAARLAERFDLPAALATQSNPLNSVTCAYLARHRNLNDFYKAVRTAVTEAEGLGIPDALLQLAQITDFSLFISTTFDRSLVRAIDAVRFHGEARTEVLRFSPYGSDDLRGEEITPAHPTVFHLLGRISHVPEYALTEEDTLEFVHALQNENRRPARLFEELDQKVLLIIGNGFNDWLARFFIRAAKRERLWLAQRRVEFLADASLRGSNLGAFLHHFSASTRLCDADPVAFIAELHERWTARQRPAAQAAGAMFASMAPGAVFISYAREDAAAADRLAEMLRSSNLDVWLDRVELQPGDPWEPRIFLNIQNASSFVPILSRHSLTPDVRFFRREWDFAAQTQVALPASVKFIFPVVVDDTPRSHVDIPAALRGRQWTALDEIRSGHSLFDSLASNMQSFHLRRATQ